MRERALAPSMVHKRKSFVVSDVKCQRRCIGGEKFVSDGEMQMTRHDTVLVVITGGFTDKFKDLGSEVLKNGGLSNLQYITTHLHKYRHVEHS